MKKIVFCAFAALAMAACGNGALDGKAETDTTTLPADTGYMDAINDTAQHVNTPTGTYPNDTIAQHHVKGDVRSSSPTSTGSRGTTPGNDTVRQKQ
ncbi:hypothetical protein EPD60_08440 [Flaviaesturariibacter flavus]|uniref:Lipoprotein n=1 Tax=Flaviaesturariibacter flavus TaxID=2502780 RepID=A0A4R1BAQ5_9BACT|nr:hypothetical protein [Flaviaesturariibacter flavus]TCJ14033.1 hypothetical protein EPD60_08440 [Flaviaesturariibacter flavus]